MGNPASGLNSLTSSFQISSLSRSFCSIKLYKNKGGEEVVDELRGQVNENRWLDKLKMKSAWYYQTEGACCWEVFKKKRLEGDDSTVVHSALERTRNDHVIKSVKKVKC